MKYFIVLFLIVIAVFFSATLGLFEIPDAFFYYTLGQFLYTGQIFSILPFNTATPQTLFSPVYGLIVYPIIAKQPISPLFLIPFIQLSMIGVSAGILSLTLKKIFPGKNHKLGVFLFLLLPFNIVYALFFMSETTTMFVVSIYLYIFVIMNRSPWRNSLLVLTASVLVLTRYAFVPLLGVSIVFLIARRQKKLITYLPAVLGGIGISLWILLHVHWYHSPQLSTFTGRHIYDNVITAGKFIPKDTANPEVARFFSFIPPNTDLVKPWWEIQPLFAYAFNAGQVTELEVDRMFLAVSIQGIKENIPAYIVHIFKLAIVTPNTPPYHDNVLSQIGFQEPNCAICGVKECRFQWLPKSCQPVLQIPFITTLFGFFLLGNKALYPFISSICMILATFGIVGSFISKDKRLISIAIVFLMQHMFQSATEWVEGRFLIPLYPFYTILIFYGGGILVQMIMFIKTNTLNRTNNTNEHHE